MKLMNGFNNRVVITGMGILSPLGLDTATTWEGLITGRSGIDYITLFDPEFMETKFAGEIKGFEPSNYMNRKDAHGNYTNRTFKEVFTDHANVYTDECKMQ